MAAGNHWGDKSGLLTHSGIQQQQGGAQSYRQAQGQWSFLQTQVM